LCWLIGERFVQRRSRTARYGGADGSENGGMSNKTRSENLRHRKSKVSWAMLINPGLVGPKARPKGVVDGQQADIPAPVSKCVGRDGTTKSARTYDLSCAAC